MQIILEFLAKVEGGMSRVKKQNQEGTSRHEAVVERYICFLCILCVCVFAKNELFLGSPSLDNKQKRASSSAMATDVNLISKLYSFPSSVSGKQTYENIHITLILHVQGFAWMF